MYVWVPDGDDCPHQFLGRVLLGVKPRTKGLAGWEGGGWNWYDKSQQVRFIVNKPVGTTTPDEPMCESHGDLMKLVARVDATVLDEDEPTFLVNSISFALNLIDEIHED